LIGGAGFCREYGRATQTEQQRKSLRHHPQKLCETIITMVSECFHFTWPSFMT
jgi:hypothetical protein